MRGEHPTASRSRWGEFRSWGVTRGFHAESSHPCTGRIPLLVHRQGRWVVQRASVQPDSARRPAPADIDDLLEKPRAQAPADELGHQAELNDLDLSRLAAIQFRESSRCPGHVEDMDFIQGVMDSDCQFVVRHPLAAIPMVIVPHAVVEKSVIAGRRRDRLHDRQVIAGCR
jgi:hypothetical protein